MIEFYVTGVNKFAIVLASEFGHLVHAVVAFRLRVSPLSAQGNFGMGVDRVDTVGEGGLVVIGIGADIAVASYTLRIGHIRKRCLPSMFAVAGSTVGDAGRIIRCAMMVSHRFFFVAVLTAMNK